MNIEIITYSVVVPVYNGEDSVGKLYQELETFFDKRYSFEVIFVDDKSEDESWKVLTEIQQKAKNVTIVRMAKNFGQHGASLCGMKYAKGDFVITIDDDLEIHPSQIDKLIELQKISDDDLVYGEYRKDSPGFFRKLFTGIYKAIAKVEGKNKGKGSSFRLLKRSLYEKLATNHKHFVFIDELCLWYTSNVSFVKVDFNTEHCIKKRYKLRGLFAIATNVIMFSSSLPLKLVTYLGLFLSLFNLSLGVYFIIKKVFFGTDYPGYSSIIVSVLFSSGIIIFCLGIIAQYIRKLLKSVNNEPSYNESEIILHVNN